MHQRPLQCTANGEAVLASLSPEQTREQLGKGRCIRLGPGSMSRVKGWRVDVAEWRAQGFALAGAEQVADTNPIGRGMLQIPNGMRSLVRRERGEDRGSHPLPVRARGGGHEI